MRLSDSSASIVISSFSFYWVYCVFDIIFTTLIIGENMVGGSKRGGSREIGLVTWWVRDP